MEIKYGRQIAIQDIDGEIDLFLMGGNHEDRVNSCFNFLIKQNHIKSVKVFCYNHSYCPNIQYAHQFKVIKTPSDIYEILGSFFENCNNQNVIKIVVDYSCMTKYWYYSILLFLSHKQNFAKKIQVIFSYTPSEFADPLSPKPNKEIAPLPGKYIVPTDKPKALIVCLGYEQNKAEGIIDHLDPKVSYLLYTKPALDEAFVSALEQNNSNLISERKGYIMTFPFDDLLFLERQLTALYFQLKEDYSIIIAPLGPKPFSLISMIMSVKYHDIDIWRVGSGSDINEYLRSPIDDKTFIVNELIFES